MTRKTLWIGVAALVVALVAATAAFATTQHRAIAVTTTTRLVAAAPAPANTVIPGACRGLMNDPAAWKGMQALSTEHFKDMQTWLKQYGSDPDSAAAQSALARLRTEHWNDMRALLGKHGAGSADSGRGAATGDLGAGYRGMMGGGGYGAGAGMMGTY